MIETNQAFSSAIISGDFSALRGIHASSKNIAIYERHIEALAVELDAIGDSVLEYRAAGSAEEILERLSEAEHNLIQYPLLYADISKLLNVFKDISGARNLRLFFGTITTDMCRKFHTDINDLRLLCTYIGPGTVWLPSEAIDYQSLQFDTKELDIRPGYEEQQVATGDVVILKGALYEDSNPVLHRSPAIESIQARRLLLRIDTDAFLSSLT